MSRITNVRTARKGLTLPEKQSPASADSLVGVGADGNLFRTPSDSVGGFDIGALPARGSPVGSDRFPLQTVGGVDYSATLSAIASGWVSRTDVTASLRGSSGNPSVTLSNRTCRVFVLGSLAFISGRITWSGLSGGSGALEIHLSNATYAPVSAWDVLGIRAQGIPSRSISNLAEGLVMSGAAGYFRISVLRGNTSPQTVNVSHLSSSGNITFSGLYQI